MTVSRKNSRPSRGGLAWNRSGRAVVWLRFLIVPAWIAATVMAMTHLPSAFEAEAGELDSLLPHSSSALEVERKALETFGHRYPEGESQYERFLVHKTIFPTDFLADLGFYTLRSAGRVELARLEFGGLQPVAEGKREKVLRVVKEAFTPAPAPVPPT